VLIGASVLVLAVLSGQPQSLGEYKVYTKSVNKMVELPTAFSSKFDIGSAMDKLKWPLTTMVKILTNAKEKALDIDLIVNEHENESDD